MKTQELLDILETNQEKTLRFEYKPGKFVESNFHITEVKNLKINSVDCGGVENNWNETILQLWNPQKESERYPMSGKKALNILTTVNRINQMDKDSTVFFEYGNNNVNISNFLIDQFETDEKFLTFRFKSKNSECKSQSRKSENNVEKGVGINSSCCNPKPEKNVKWQGLLRK
ncbi:MAG: hypothetical protein D8M58_17685 [Calditrichaeota bacterium]|nr:MAG: hypothetical protein DWQ03_01600 [Calditrichota bacterium]MBL1207239.1 hypothetical protein [Calditrichota bacterium]NOG47072.1 hypothetical protein [Calditrichota bacterium]